MPSMAGAGARGAGARSPGAYGGREGRPDRRDRAGPRVRRPAGRVCVLDQHCVKSVKTLGSVMCRLFGRSPAPQLHSLGMDVAYSCDAVHTKLCGRLDERIMYACPTHVLCCSVPCCCVCCVCFHQQGRSPPPRRAGGERARSRSPTRRPEYAGVCVCAVGCRKGQGKSKSGRWLLLVCGQ